MDVDTSRTVDEIVPITRDTDAAEVALAAYGRLVDLLASLEPEQWRLPTECPGWDVAAMVGHLIGAAKAGASVRENLRQQAWGARHASEYGNALDAANERQILDHAGLPSQQRVDCSVASHPPRSRAGCACPDFCDGVRVPLDAGGSTAPGMPDRLSPGHLMDVVYTRDVWLHTVDIARATGRAHEPDEVDHRIVEDVVAEWAGRHGQPFVLALAGTRAVRFRQGEGGGHLHLNAIEFCRVLSGRAGIGRGVVATPPETAHLLETRVVF